MLHDSILFFSLHCFSLSLWPSIAATAVADDVDDTANANTTAAAVTATATSCLKSQVSGAFGMPFNLLGSAMAQFIWWPLLRYELSYPYTYSII